MSKRNVQKFKEMFKMNVPRFKVQRVQEGMNLAHLIVTNAHVRRISKLNDKAIRIMNFAKYHDDPSEHYKNLNILKFQDIIKLNNYLYIHDHFNLNLPTSLLDNFKFIKTSHNHNTRISGANCVELPKSNTLEYGIHSVFGQASRHWNHFQVILNDSKLHTLSKYSCKELISKHLMNSY